MEKKNKILKDGKTQNITIRVTEELRQKVQELHEKHYPDIPFNAFLGHLVRKGLEKELPVAKYREIKDELDSKNDQKAINEAEADESSPIHGIRKKAAGD